MQLIFSTSIPYLHNLIAHNQSDQDESDKEFIFQIIKTIFLLFIQSNYLSKIDNLILNNG